MIQKSLFQKRINESNVSISYDEKQNCQNNKNPILFKEKTNLAQLAYKCSDQIDYKSLYEHQIILNEQLAQRIQLLKQKIKLLQSENQELKQNFRESRQQPIDSSSQYYISLPKKSHKQLLFQEIRSFKENLPNPMKVIEFQELDNFQSVNFLTDHDIISKNCLTSIKEIQDGRNLSILNEHKSQKSIANSAVTLKLINDESLIDCLAMYGLSEEFKVNEDDDEEYYEGELKYCSKAPHQIVKHSSMLIFPYKTNKAEVEIYSDDEAIEFAVEQITQTLKSQQIKAFTLIFEPASLPNQDDYQNDKSQFGEYEKKQPEIIEMINKERRFYAISVAFRDFDLIDNNQVQRFPNISLQNSLEEVIFNINIKEVQTQERKIKQQKTQYILNKSAINESPSKTFQNNQNLSIRVSRKVITFFTKYPFIHFFEELLVHCLKESFQCRKNQMKKNISNLKNFDHSKTIDFLKTFYQNLNQSYQLNKKFASKINEIFEIQFHSARLNRFQTLSLQLSKTLIKNFYSQIWAYPVLRLFTLDNFLDVFALVMLEEKIIFVCENQSILTSAIFLFTKVFMKPFDYPYPVVSIIPNEYDYFNAPFPIVYGCLTSKENLVKEKIPKIYKNVYVILTASGVEIMANKNASRLQARKSPKLRDKLLPYFLKMENQQKQWNQQKPVNNQRFSGFTSLLGFNNSTSSNQSQSSTKKKFNFSTNNRQLSHQIIEKVFQYLSQIKEQIPSRQKVNEIRTNIQNQIKEKNTPESQNLDIDKETYERVKNKMLKKTSDPFVQKFLQTQIVGLEILR